MEKLFKHFKLIKKNFLMFLPLFAILYILKHLDNFTLPFSYFKNSINKLNFLEKKKNYFLT